MKKILFAFCFLLSALNSFSQQLVPYDRSRVNQVLDDRATWSRYYIGLPSGTVPFFPSYVPDSLKCKAFFNVLPGVMTPGLYRYDCASGLWQIVGASTAPVSSVFSRTGAIVAATNDYTFAQIGSKPTTLLGYGITDAYPLTGNPSAFLTGINSSQVTTALGYTPVTNARTLTINGTALDLSADRSWTITSGVSTVFGRSGAVVAATNDYTFAQIGSTPTTLLGYGITDAYPLTGNPSAFLTGINSSQVTTALGYTPVTNARTITINGTSLDLSANRSWTITGGLLVGGETPSGTINGSNPTFTLAHTPLSGSLSVYINGIMERPITDWTLSGTTITMIDIPLTGSNLLVNYQY